MWAAGRTQTNFLTDNLFPEVSQTLKDSNCTLISLLKLTIDQWLFEWLLNVAITIMPNFVLLKSIQLPPPR